VAKYLVKELSFINNSLVPAGEVIDYDPPEGTTVSANLEPVKKGKAAKDAAHHRFLRTSNPSRRAKQPKTQRPSLALTLPEPAPKFSPSSSATETPDSDLAGAGLKRLGAFSPALLR
jgi:hypothetical protein